MMREHQRIIAPTPMRSSEIPNLSGMKITIPPSPTPPRTPSPSPWSTGTREENGIPIPQSVGRSEFQPPTYIWGPPDSSKKNFTAPSSWKTGFAPSSWGGNSVLLNDEASVYGDDQSDRATDRGTEVGSSASLTYARQRRLLRQMSKSSMVSTATTRHTFSSAKERWTKKLEDFREYEVGLFKSLLPLKAAVGASLAACLCFAPFVPELLTYYGTVAVLGVGMSLESNVGLTLQKGYNLMLGSCLAGACALVVSLLEPYTGTFRVYYLVFCVFLGGCLPRLISLPAIIKTRWAQTLTYYISVFHGLILNKSIKMQYTFQFFLNCVCYSTGFLIVFSLALCVKPDYAGDALLVLLVSDFHTAGVVLERIVEDYKSGLVLTKIQELLSGVVTEDHIHHDLQYIMKSTSEVEKLMGAVKWEPPHGKFFSGYPWDLYPTLLAMLLHVMYDLIALDSALRAEIQAPLPVRLLFAEEMEIVARECSMLFHKVGDALLEHKKIDYHSNVQRAKLATLNLRMKLSYYSAIVIAQDYPPQHQSTQMTRTTSLNSSYQEAFDDLPVSMTPAPSCTPAPSSTPVPSCTPAPTPPPSPREAGRVIEQDFETVQKLTLNENDWRARLFLRRQSISENWEDTQQQISSLSFIKFATILIELMAKVKIVVTMVDQISVKARFTEVVQ